MARNRLTSPDLFDLQATLRLPLDRTAGCQASEEMLPANSRWLMTGSHAPVSSVEIPAWARPIYEAAFLTARIKVRNRKVLDAALTGTMIN
ncbi:hypothetical protein Plim_2779 [Planctopirus limnophila DSM 3776]|uniref:Uncharacterized protein n=1 Tax=Planctopirus limnophila (strain ATCC 43296 / DSM 3776 / IFAM 1008 / Mu 290) TaxID=521674 RepID=D5SRA9_PLAL2|nr:hypothetical protein [Planctopirus limnophila]ADG68602.1 hypothetical protein Plim_2779 [Planctopirus limnophila DSM 3776]